MWSANPTVLVTDLGDELVLMHPERSEMFSLNAAGRQLWLALPASEETLTRTLQGAYGLTPAQAGGDVQALLADLQARDLLSRM